MSFRNGRRGLIAAFALTLALPSLAAAQDALPAADALIDRYVEALGGRDVILSREGSRSIGTVSMPAAGIEGSLEIIASRSPTRVISRIEIPGMGTILNGYTGEVGWSMDPNLGPRLLDGMELASIVEGSSTEAALRDPSLLESRETVERTEMNGEACYRVHLVWKSGRESDDCYSVESGLLVATITNHESPMGTFEAVTLLSDYRDFDGIQAPTRMTQQVLGQEEIITLETVEYEAIDPAAFEPPAAIRTLIEEREASAGGTR